MFYVYVCRCMCVYAYMHVAEKYQFYRLQSTRDYSIYFFLLIKSQLYLTKNFL